MKRAITLGAAVLLLLALGPWLLAQSPSAPPPSQAPSGNRETSPQNLGLAEAYGRLPLSFEANDGQTDRRVKFLSRSADQTLFLTSEEAVLAPRAGHPVRMKLAGGRADASISGVDRLPGKSNYFLGNDPAKWHANVSTYAK